MPEAPAPGDADSWEAADAASGEGPILLYSIKQIELATRAHLDELLKPAGVTTLQYTAMSVLERSGAMSAAELARRSFVTAQSMADMVRVLSRKELISRSRDTADRKRLLISLTEEGEDLLDGVRGPVAELDRRITGSMTARQRAALRQSLNECRAALRHLPLGG